MFDFGQVNAGWLEFECVICRATVECSISEFNEPAVFNLGSEHPVKTAVPEQYGKTYRLELNKQLYEGVRFAWIHLKDVSRKFRIRNVRLVCQTKPTNYEGSFNSNDEQLNRIWYTAAYTVRLNLLKDYFGAILMERSDPVIRGPVMHTLHRLPLLSLLVIMILSVRTFFIRRNSLMVS